MANTNSTQGGFLGNLGKIYLGYTGGFIGHYITEPLGFPIEATSTQVGVCIVAFLPNLVGYGLLAARARGRVSV